MESAVGLLPRLRGLGPALAVLGLAGGMLLVATDAAHAQDEGGGADPEPLPIVFVHGGAGSAQQYESVARRFASNGFPDNRIETYEYNSASAAAIAAAPAGVEALINDLRERFDVDQVNLVGHSLGTFVSNNFLSDPARRALVRHYVGIDGASNTTCRDVWEPDPNENIECMGIWAQPQGTRAVGSTNHSFNGQQTHVESATSPESFRFQYEFFLGEEPDTDLVLPEPPDEVEISGRAVDFPANAGVDGATLEVYAVHGATGQRKSDEPEATFQIGPDGRWGPLAVNGNKHYEFVIRRGENRQHHLYTQPFVRDDRWVRLLTSPPGSAIPNNTNIGSNHTTTVIVRQKEWWTTHPSGRNDDLEISTESPSQGDEPPVDVLQNVTSNGTIGLHVHDGRHNGGTLTPGVSTLNLLDFFPTQPFQSGIDVFMPAANPPDGTITIRNAPRGDASRVQELNIPNWTSDGHATTSYFNDYVQDVDSWGECKRARNGPCG
jgi:pimeloyl-ACP methyl ester carboxylesterase